MLEFFKELLNHRSKQKYSALHGVFTNPRNGNSTKVIRRLERNATELKAFFELLGYEIKIVKKGL